MKKTTELARRKTAMIKAHRAAIRLKHSLEADDEIAIVLPQIEEEIDAALAAGKPLSLNPGSVFQDDEPCD